MKNYIFLTIGVLMLIGVFIISGFQKNIQVNYNFSGNNYENEWKSIDSLEQQGLPKSALELTETLLAKTQKEKNAPQMIKALLYRGKYQSQLEEGGVSKAIYRFEQEIDKAEFPVKQVLQSITAEMYHNFLQTNIWKFRNRTETINFDNADILTWSPAQIAEKSMQLYNASLEDKRIQSIDIKDLEPILYYYKETQKERPTLYDFLSHRAIDHFMNDQSYLTKPAYSFTIKDKEAFDPHASFSQFEFKTQDSLSMKYHTLLKFQELLDFHKKDKEQTALITSDLKRLHFVYNNSTSSNKEDLYMASLEQMKKQCGNTPASAEISYEIAKLYKIKGDRYQPSPEEKNKYDLKKAVEICDQTIAKYPKSIGAGKCKSLRFQILQKSVIARVEQVHTINDPMLINLEYKNVEKVYLKILPLTEELNKSIQRINHYDKINKLNKVDPLTSWNASLPNDGDHQMHTTELIGQGLKSGQYILMVADNPAFSYSENAVGFTLFDVSNIAYFVTDERKDKNKGFFAVDRITGKPLSGVKVECFRRNYNSGTRTYEFILLQSGVTDKNGYYASSVKKSVSYRIKMTYKNDVLFLENNYNHYRSSDPKGHTRISFFLDRAIYRPGQTVYFKGIVMDIDKDQMPSIKTNYTTTVKLFDTNYQIVDEVEVSTNEYGTFNGQFTAPSSGLLGQMHLGDTRGYGNKYFRVEEYKRPKFEVDFKPVEGSYKLGEQVKITGEAKAYAGSSIDGAKVSYRVVRQVRFPYWCWWRWGWHNPYTRQDMEITNGFTTTDENGNFDIEFDAIPDESVPADRNPIFTYKVLADVIDITGETHSATGFVSAGYVALDVNIAVPDKIVKDSLSSFAINTVNLNGQFEPAKGEITIERLKRPQVFYKNRYWNAPDKPVISKQDFQKNFPDMPFNEEHKIENYPVDKKIKTINFNTGENKELEVKSYRMNAGAYKLRLTTKDKFGTDIEIVSFFEVIDYNDKSTPVYEALWDILEKNPLQPGETAVSRLGSYFDDAQILFLREDNELISEKKWIKASGVEKESLLVKESHRGNTHYKMAMIRNNRKYHTQQTIYVPWSNKDLKIEYATFRDKLYPGQDEEWQIKISGPNGDKVSAEMLVGMYDASLDAFAANYWNMNLFPTNYPRVNLSFSDFRNQQVNIYGNNWNESYNVSRRNYNMLNWFGFYFNNNNYQFSSYSIRGSRNAPGVVSKSKAGAMPAPMAEESVMMNADVGWDADEDGIADNIEQESIALTDSSVVVGGKKEGKKEEDLGEVKVRTNLNETVFFFPELMTDSEGNITIKFKMNEALTRWKFMGFAHTKDLKYALTQKEIVTQKELMVIPNPPRFLREGDEIHLTAKVSNLTENEMVGQAEIQLFDAFTMQPVDAKYKLQNARQDFTAKGGQSAPLSWQVNVPMGAAPIVYRIIAKAGDFSDGEENALPVLTNRMMVTETMPLPIRGKQKKEYTFKAMEKASASNTLSHHKMTLEFTSNPAWYAIQALPYLMEYPYDCTEQVFSRYYANSLATSVANSHPKVQRVFEQWKNTDAMLSNLSKNQELKTALLEETPWVLNAQSEERQKKRIGLLFDLNKMANEQAQALDKLAKRQMGNGGWSWFPGGRDSWYISQYIVEGLGHLDRLGVKDIKSDKQTTKMLEKAINYIDNRVADKYTELLSWVKYKKIKLEDDHLDYMVIHYLYARSFFDQKISNPTTKEATDYYLGQADKYWVNKNMYHQGMLALGLQRKGRLDTPKKIAKSLKERSLNNEEMGMYWKYNTGYYWYQLPIETHALMIEVFDEVANDAKAVDDLKVWMLKTKQTTHWKTTKATAAAVYALLMRGDNWLLEDAPVKIKIGNEYIEPIAPGAANLKDKPNVKRPVMEAGTGYFKTTWDGDEITNNMSKVEVENPNSVVAWGAMYWQYLEQLDKIKTFEDTPLKLKKQLFKETNSPTGPKINPISEGAKLEPGDKLKVRIELRVDRDMEYVHMKDMRASGLEPMNVLSQYKWQGGLGYYESTRDVSTNFFFSYLPKGTYVFEYPLRVNHKGDFSNGITTIQCMYAPEFTSHSEGIRLSIE